MAAMGFGQRSASCGFKLSAVAVAGAGLCRWASAAGLFLTRRQQHHQKKETDSLQASMPALSITDIAARTRRVFVVDRKIAWRACRLFDGPN